MHGHAHRSRPSPTAAHCVPDGDPLQVLFGDGKDGRPREERNVIDRKRFLEEGLSVFPNFDVGWLRIEGALPAGYRPIEMLSDPSALQKDAALTLVGTGVVARGGEGSGVMRTVDTVVDRYLDSSRAHGLFSYGPTPGKGECKGDSGGPAYMKVDGRWFLAGTVNGADGRLSDRDLACNGSGIHTFSFAYKTWIEETAHVALPGPPGKAVTTFGVTHGLTTFRDWCDAPVVPLETWKTLDALSKEARSFDCEAIETAIGPETAAQMVASFARNR